MFFAFIFFSYFVRTRIKIVQDYYNIFEAELIKKGYFFGRKRIDIAFRSGFLDVLDGNPAKTGKDNAKNGFPAGFRSKSGFLPAPSGKGQAVQK
jgi:hypothetical protein